MEFRESAQGAPQIQASHQIPVRAPSTREAVQERTLIQSPEASSTVRCILPFAIATATFPGDLTHYISYPPATGNPHRQF